MQITDASIIYPTTSPENFSGLVSWHEADALNGLVGHQQPVQTMFDLYKNNFDVTQATLANRPKLFQGACNGHSVLRFDGIQTFLQNTAYADYGDTYTVISVAAFAPGIGNTFQAIADFTIGATSPSGFNLFFTLAGTIMTASGNDSVGVKSATTTVDVRDGKFHIYTLVNTGVNVSLYIDSILRGGPTAYTAPNPNVLSRITLGAGANGASFFGGDLTAIIAYNVARTDPERLAIEQNYIRRKFFGTES